MTIWIDPPAWPAYGRLWSHLVSDVSLDELHEFATAAGLPRRGFEGDHYDIPEDRYAQVVAAGANPTTSRDLVRRLRISGLRVMKRHSDRLVTTLPSVPGPDGAVMRVDLFTARFEPPEAATRAVAVLLSDGAGRQAVVHSVQRQAWGPPSGLRESGESVRQAAVREVVEETGIVIDPEALDVVGYERLTFLDGRPHGRFDLPTLSVAVFQQRLTGPVPPLVPQALDVDAAEWVGHRDFSERCGHEFWWPLVGSVLLP